MNRRIETFLAALKAADPSVAYSTDGPYITFDVYLSADDLDQALRSADGAA